MSKNYIKSNAKLTNQQKRFCRCILHIAAKNKKTCNKTKKWNNKNKCYNPYSTCAKKVKTTTGGKPCYYKFKKSSIPKNEIIAYIYLHYYKYNKWLKKNKKKKISDMNIDDLRKNTEKWYNSYKINK